VSEVLSAEEQAALVALAEACNWSINAHVSVEAFTRKFKTHLRGDAKKTLKKLKKRGYCTPHPTGGSTTYQLTDPGLIEAKLILARSSETR